VTKNLRQRNSCRQSNPIAEGSSLLRRKAHDGFLGERAAATFALLPDRGREASNGLLLPDEEVSKVDRSGVAAAAQALLLAEAGGGAARRTTAVLYSVWARSAVWKTIRPLRMVDRELLVS
jgi:hypothetical protein